MNSITYNVLERLKAVSYTHLKAGETRQRVIAAFEMLFTKREDRPSKKHGTV